MTFVEVDDTNFPCLAANIGGVIIPESLDIIECCQDPDNLNIIYLTCAIAGAFNYVPVVAINGIDVSSFFIADYKGIGLSSFPITTNCATNTVTMAYLVGASIPNYSELSVLEIRVQFVGTLPETISPLIAASGVFVSNNPVAIYQLNKGISPQPYRLYYDALTNQLRVQYSNMGNQPCLCAINCTSPEEGVFNLTLCEDEIQEITIDSTVIVGDPTNVNIVFQDSIGNTSSFDIHALINVVPMKPSVMLKANPTHIQVGVFYKTATSAEIRADKSKYQIWKYENNVGNSKIWKDWTSKPWKIMYDREIRSGRKYGYAIRFQGEFGEISELSDWVEVQV